MYNDTYRRDELMRQKKQSLTSTIPTAWKSARDTYVLRMRRRHIWVALKFTYDPHTSIHNTHPVGFLPVPPADCVHIWTSTCMHTDILLSLSGLVTRHCIEPLCIIRIRRKMKTLLSLVPMLPARLPIFHCFAAHRLLHTYGL